MAKWDLDAVDKLEEINRLQAQTIERQALEIVELVGQRDGIERLAVFRGGEIEALREQLRQAQQSLRNARDSALEECAAKVWTLTGTDAYVRAIRSLKSTTQGSRE